MTPTELLAPPVPTCAHCGLPVSESPGGDEEAPRFCCTGCAAVWDILHGHGLDRYYDLPERRNAPVRESGKSYEEFDHPAFHALYVRPGAGGTLETELYLEGVHCASCVWLVERAPLLIPGVARAELEVGRALARVAWDPAATSLAAIARFLDGLGYRAHPFRGRRMEALRQAEDRAMLVRIGVAGALAANVMTVAIALYAGWLDGMEPVYFNYFRWVSLLLTTPALLWPGRVFFQGAFGALRARTLHMDVPIAVALAAGYVRGAINTVTGTGPIYFDGVAALIFLLLVGRFLQQRAQRAATNATELLHGLSPATARLVDGGTIREVPTEALLPGMLVEIRAGDTVPADGVVVEGRSELDLALLTGESRPKAASCGDRVFAGTVNLASALRVEVEQSGEESRLGRLLRQVEAGAGRRAPVVQAADRLAGRFVAVILLLALVTFAYWWPRDPDQAIDHAIALLIVTCPCALALATPLAITVAIGRAARAGILIKGGDALELLGRPGTLYLDKTGTLTEGRTRLVAWEGPEAIRPFILALERHSTHPVAAGFLAAWPDLRVVEATEVRQTLGGGLEGWVEGRHVVVGSPAYVAANTSEPDTLRPAADPALTPVLVAVDGSIVARAGFGDPVRAEAEGVLRRLRGRGWRLQLLSGDEPDVVGAVAQRLGFGPGSWRGAATPEAKLAEIDRAAGEGPVVMVGDGVNDAAAMARASVGVAVRGGAEASLAVADVYLSRPGLRALDDLVAGSERTLRVIRRNIGFSLAYNVAGAALAMTGVITPLLAAVMMPASSLTVVLASWRSRTFWGRP